MLTARHIRRRAVALGLACTLLGAGAAAARPLPHYAVAEPTVTAPAQDLRNPDHRTVEAARAQERYYGSYGSDAGEPAQDLRSPDARDAAAGRGTVNAPDAISQVFTDRQRAMVERFKRSPSHQQALREAMLVNRSKPAPVRSDDGIDWGDASIGAGSLLGVIALALAGTMAIMHRRRRDPRPATVA